MTPLICSRSSVDSPGTPRSTKSRASILSAQHTRLLISMLPFKNPVELDEWISRPPVSAAWLEFRASVPAIHPDPNVVEVCNLAERAIISAPPSGRKFCLLHPDKRGWSIDDHHVRFIVGIAKDSLEEQAWDSSKWIQRSQEIAKALYEVLVYLKTTSGPRHGRDDSPTAQDKTVGPWSLETGGGGD
jgi:hypothetical protein